MKLSTNTARVYRSLYSAYTRWCAIRSLDERSFDVVISYLIERSRVVSFVSLGLDRSAIGHHHRTSPGDTPVDSDRFRGFLRVITRKMSRSKTPKKAATRDITRLMLETCDSTPVGVRNRAILTVLFATGMRGGELAALTWEDLTFADGDVSFLIRRSKTDQEGIGRSVSAAARADSFCPVSALVAWRNVGGDTGPVFTSFKHRQRRAICQKSVALVVKEAAKAAGFDPKDFGSHSMRRGFATSMYNDRSKGELWFVTLVQAQEKLGHATLRGTFSYVEESPRSDHDPLPEGLL